MLGKKSRGFLLDSGTAHAMTEHRGIRPLLKTPRGYLGISRFGRKSV